MPCIPSSSLLYLIICIRKVMYENGTYEQNDTILVPIYIILCYIENMIPATFSMERIDCVYTLCFIFSLSYDLNVRYDRSISIIK